MDALSASKRRLDDIRDILARVTFPGYQFEVRAEGDGHVILGWLYAEDNFHPGKKEYRPTREWYVGSEMQTQGIVNTVLKLVQCAEEHELLEKFRYRGVAIYDPHREMIREAR